MKELNELVELAKMATAGDWTTDIRGSVVAVDDKANSGFIICSAGGCDKSHNAAFIAAANPAAILAIDEAIRALEQRAEAAEAKLAAARGVKKSWQERAWTAEEKLAELEKQEPVFQIEVSGNHWLNAGPVEYSDFTSMPDGMNLLYVRPAPAVSLMDLVPDEMTLDSDTETVTESGHVQAVKWWNACRAAILRNIEEQSQ